METCLRIPSALPLLFQRYVGGCTFPTISVLAIIRSKHHSSHRQRTRQIEGALNTLEIKLQINLGEIGAFGRTINVALVLALQGGLRGWSFNTQGKSDH